MIFVVDVRERWREMTVVPRAAISLPLPLPLPPGFDPADLATWPQVEGRLEYVEGRLEFMPPCAEEQQRTVVDIVGALFTWRRRHPEFVVGSNEAGMVLGGDVRAADAAVWARADLEDVSTQLARVPPLLAVEVAGRDDDRDALLEKARWYLDHGVTTIWIIVPRTWTVSVVDAAGVTDHGYGAELPEPRGLLALNVRVDALFEQLDGR